METVGVEVVHKTLSSTSLIYLDCKYNKYYLVGGRGNEFRYIFNITGCNSGGWFGHPEIGRASCRERV